MRHCQSFFKLIGRNIRILRSSWVRQGPKSFLAISTSHILQTVIIIFANKTKRWRGGSLLLLANQLNFFTPAFGFHPFLIIESQRGSRPQGYLGSGPRCGTGSLGPLICQSPHGMASGGQEEPFSRLALTV